MKKDTKFWVYGLTMAWLGSAVAIFFDYDWTALYVMPTIWILGFVWWWAVKTLFKDFKKVRKSTKRSKSK